MSRYGQICVCPYQVIFLQLIVSLYFYGIHIFVYLSICVHICAYLCISNRVGDNPRISGSLPAWSCLSQPQPEAGPGPAPPSPGIVALPVVTVLVTPTRGRSESNLEPH